MDKDNILKDLYYDKSSTAYLSSAKTLHNIVKQNHKGITLKYVSDWLTKQEVNQRLNNKQDIYYPPIVAEGSDDYQCDLTFFDQYKRYNKGYCIIMVFIEITTRKAYCYPLKNKTGVAICEAYKLFLKDVNNKVNNLTTDNGTEFTSAAFKKIDSEHDIIHHFVDAGDKTSMGKAERYNRTLRDRITKHQKAFKTLNWVDVLNSIVENYNNTVHSSIDLAPNEVTEEQAAEIRGYDTEKRNHAIKIVESYHVGDKVRLLKKKNVFDKGGATFTKAIYTIENVDKLALILKDSKGNVIDKRVKPHEVKVINDVETAPEKEEIEKHSSTDNKKLNKFVNKQNREEAFDVVDQNDGKVELAKKLVPEKLIRTRQKALQVNDKVTSTFNMPGGTRQSFEGVIQKVNPKTVVVLFSDGDKLYMKKNEVILINDAVVKEKIIEKVKNNDHYNIYQIGDRVKSIFNLDGVETAYYGNILKYFPRTDKYKVKYDDGDVQYMRENELVKII